MKATRQQDTHLLGTRGYAPPEQYGFSQTDERADIYALGVTLKQFLGEHAGKKRYKRIIQKCTELNPDQRYQSVSQVKRTLSCASDSFACYICNSAGCCYRDRCVAPACLRRDSPYVLSDVFQYTGESAPQLPAPTELSWRITEGDESRRFYATFDMDPYEDRDMFYIFVYDSKGDYVMSSYWYKSDILEREIPGIPIKAEFLSALDESFRFAVQVLTSRPNEYHSSPAVSPYPPSNAYFSPWFKNSPN